jgi:uncharacterized protein YndB with AHSA1/START domain
VTRPIVYSPDPKLDLVLERIVDVPRELVWQAWTVPEHVKKWFTPRPWTTVECEIDLRPGGIFRFVSESPEGERFPHVGCYLEVIENERVVWTRALLPGYRPTNPKSDVPVFTAIISLAPHGKGTKYTAIAMHQDEEGCRQHDKMGFHEGWGTVLDQLVEVAKKM